MKISIIIEDKDCEVKVLEVQNEETTEKSRKNVSQYARWFDDGCTGWINSAEYNLIFLKQQEMYATDLLKNKGYLFLNDVYNMLGIPRSKVGQIVGWVYNEKNPIGDNYVDFGIHNEINKDFINGKTGIALLDFNVDGSILSYI